MCHVCPLILFFRTETSELLKMLIKTNLPEYIHRELKSIPRDNRKSFIRVAAWYNYLWQHKFTHWFSSLLSPSLLHHHILLFSSFCSPSFRAKVRREFCFVPYVTVKQKTLFFKNPQPLQEEPPLLESTWGDEVREENRNMKSTGWMSGSGAGHTHLIRVIQ